MGPIACGCRGFSSFNFDERAASVQLQHSAMQRVSRRYFFRGIEREGTLTGFPRAAHYDCFVEPPPGDSDRKDSVGSGPTTPPDRPSKLPRQQHRFDYVDTLVSAMSRIASGECDTVKVNAEDLAALLADSRPFAKDDARPMFLLTRDVLKALVSGQLEIVTAQSEALGKSPAQPSPCL